MSKYYSRKELMMRIIWNIAHAFFFRTSMRHFYGWRNLILRLFQAKIGKNVKIYPSVKITLPWLLELGDNIVISAGVNIYNLGKISIGSNTVISQYAHLCGGTHDIQSPGFRLLRTGLTINKNVWIAADAFIGPGVTISDNAVVGARAVVFKDVETDTIVIGNPAHVIRTRTKQK